MDPMFVGLPPQLLCKRKSMKHFQPCVLQPKDIKKINVNVGYGNEQPESFNFNESNDPKVIEIDAR